MKKIIFTFFVIFLSVNGNSQTSYSFPEDFNKPIYFFDPVAAHKELLKRPEAKSDKQGFESYLITRVYHQQYEFDNNNLFMDWDEMEGYILKILDTVISQKDRKNLNVFISRSTEANASMDKFGFMYLNIGMIASALDEAELAEIIGHETGHYLFKHNIKHTGDFNNLQDYKGDFDLASLDILYQKNRKYESQADSFSFECMKRCGYGLSSTQKRFEMIDMKNKVFKYHASYDNLKKLSEMTDQELVKRSNKNFEEFSSHPENVERYFRAKFFFDKCKTPVRNFKIDSVLFVKLKKMAQQEQKRIAFDNCEYKECVRYCFIDYLYDSKKLRNLYLLCESLRRLIYSKPEIAKKPFLAEHIGDKKLFNYNKSILYKSDYLFENYNQYEELKNHKFFKDDVKPFNTYEEAFYYFSEEALKSNINEARFGLALHYFSINRMDSTKKLLSQYISSGTGLYMDFAKDLLAFESPKTSNDKTLIIYNNTENYSGDIYNYYYTLMRKNENEGIRKVFSELNTKYELVFINELMGNKPRQLFGYQKLMKAIFSLYTEKEIGVLAKYNNQEAESKKAKELMLKSRKYFLVYAPEWYNSFKAEGVGKLYFANVSYLFSNYFSTDEYEDNYTAFYLDINSLTPSFKEPKRQSKKQTDIEIAGDILFFLKEK